MSPTTAVADTADVARQVVAVWSVAFSALGSL